MTPRPLSSAPRDEWVLGHLDFGEEDQDTLQWSIVMRSGDDRWIDTMGHVTPIDGWVPLPERQYPHIHKVGRYAFFALCAYGLSILAYGVAKSLGISAYVSGMATSISMFAAFLALRDMTKAAPNG